MKEAHYTTALVVLVVVVLTLCCNSQLVGLLLDEEPRALLYLALSQYRDCYPRGWLRMRSQEFLLLVDDSLLGVY